MTLGRLRYRYQFELQGKQIIVRKYLCCFRWSFCIKEIKLSQCELITPSSEDIDECDYSYTFFIKEGENKMVIN